MFIFSQNISGKITYEAEIIIKEKQNIKKDADFDVMMKTQKKVSYKLLFNKNETIFKNIEKLTIDNNKLNLVKILAGNCVFYSNKKSKKTLNQKESFNKLFLIDIPLYNLKLSQETKKIGKYICFKAITNIEIDTRSGK
jgi:GLPGLI family protein